MVNYWLVRFDRREPIEDRPGWIWHLAKDGQRVPPNYRQVTKGDRFVLISAGEGVHEAYGLYEVTEQLPPGNKPERDVVPSGYKPRSAFVIRGRLLKGLKQKWVAIPNITTYYGSKYTRMAIIPAKSRRAFGEIRRIVTRYCSAEIDFSPLASEPVTEQEVVALFCANLTRLGYKEAARIQQRWPDITAVNPRGARDYIEIEYYASDYGRHRHRLTHKRKRVKCMCWVDDRNAARKTRNRPPVIELRKTLAS